MIEIEYENSIIKVKECKIKCKCGNLMYEWMDAQRVNHICFVCHKDEFGLTYKKDFREKIRKFVALSEIKKIKD